MDFISQVTLALSPAQPNPGYTQCTNLPFFLVLLKKRICTSRLPTWQAKEITLSLFMQSGISLATLLVPDVRCRQCVIDEAQKIMAAEGAEGTDPKWTTKRGEVVLKAYVRPEFVTTIHEEPDNYVLRERRELNKLVYEGSVRIIRTTVRYQNPARGGYWVHLSEHERFKHPLRTTIRITAKLSMQGNDHLDRESLNYQAFPDHFFQHWNGYNVVSPLNEPVPVGAVVAQYYGHYVPDEDIPVRKEKTAAVVDEVVQSDIGDVCGGEELHYRSPIILMENCGSPIDIDDK